MYLRVISDRKMSVCRDCQIEDFENCMRRIASSILRSHYRLSVVLMLRCPARQDRLSNSFLPGHKRRIPRLPDRRQHRPDSPLDLAAVRKAVGSPHQRKNCNNYCHLNRSRTGNPKRRYSILDLFDHFDLHSLDLPQYPCKRAALEREAKDQQRKKE